MKTVLYKAESRGGGEHGWLSTRHSFSFANWYDPARMGFGALRVLNDDTIAAHEGFGAHSHQDFEIITIVTKGAVSHEDSMGTKAKVAVGEVQVMSAGTGVTHAEKNDGDEPLELFQLWIAPDARGVAPRYDQKEFPEAGRAGAWQLLVSGTGEDGSLMIHQDAKISRVELAAGAELGYTLAPRAARGAYLFVIEGSVDVQGTKLGRRDAIGISESGSFTVKAETPSSVLCIEVPPIGSLLLSGVY